MLIIALQKNDVDDKNKFNMKKLIILLAIAINVIACHTQKKAISGNKNYISYSKFNNDTLKYLKTNFENNKAFYIGKTIKTLVDDSEINVLSLSPLVPKKDQKVYGVSLFFVNNNEKSDKIYEGGGLYCIIVNFQEGISGAEVFSKENSTGVWNPSGASFYGERIIKDIEVVHYEYPLKQTH